MMEYFKMCDKIFLKYLSPSKRYFKLHFLTTDTVELEVLNGKKRAIVPELRQV